MEILIKNGFLKDDDYYIKKDLKKGFEYHLELNNQSLEIYKYFIDENEEFIFDRYSDNLIYRGFITCEEDLIKILNYYEI